MTIKHPSFFASAILAGLQLSACGGGGAAGNELAEPAQALATTPLPSTVRVEGCVVDSQWMGVPGAAIHVRTAQGRAVGTAVTKATGVFTLSVPAQSTLLVSTVAAGPADIEFNTADSPVSLGACLRPDL